MDGILIGLEGTATRERLGGNATIATSMAGAGAVALGVSVGIH